MGQCYCDARNGIPLHTINITFKLWFIFLKNDVFSLYMASVDFILESNIEDFIQSVKHQNILLEVDNFKNRNSTDDLSYNGAIIVSGEQKVYLSLASCFCFYEKINKVLHFSCFKTVKSQPSWYTATSLENILGHY